jgi:hypothetical protein
MKTFFEFAKDHPWLLRKGIFENFNDKLMPEKCQFEIGFNEIFTLS